MTNEQIEKLERLSKLKQDGVITDEEFENNKKKILQPVIIDKKGNVIEKSNNLGCLWGILIFFVIIIFFAISNDKPKYNSSYKKTEYMTQNDSLKRAYQLAKVILKESLKNPDSYDEVYHNEYFIRPDRKKNKKKVRIEVQITYRATNSFNAIITETKYFGFDKSFLLVNLNE